MADIIQSQDLKDLCSVLVVLSSEAAKTYQGIIMVLSSHSSLPLFFLFFFYSIPSTLVRSSKKLSKSCKMDLLKTSSFSLSRPNKCHRKAI